MKKLTLSAEPEVIEQARQLAAETGTSVSSLFARFIRLMARQRQSRPRIGPITRRASGMITLPRGKNERDIISDALCEKYGIDR